MSHDHDQHEIHDHDRGLVFDLQTLVARRHALKLLGGAGLVALVGCGANTTTGSGSTGSTSGSSSSSSSSSSSPSSTTSASGSCEEVPAETAGPFPGDGSNGPNVLTRSGIVRSDITKSFGSASRVAEGVPLTIRLTVDAADTCSARSGAAVYLWHCDRDGDYSLYSDSISGENYLRGVQETDASGTVTFTSIFPGAYSGRWPHIHFEVYASLSDATSAGKISATSQIALPEAACNEVYATEGYSQSVRNLSQSSLESDNVFGDDGGVRQLAAVTGNTTDGYTATLTIAV